MTQKHNSNSSAKANNIIGSRERGTQAVVFDDFSGNPIVITCIGGRWWLTTSGMKLQPVKDYFEGADADLYFLCEPGTRVGALAIAKMLGRALTHPEDAVGDVMCRRLAALRRLGVTLDVRDEPLELKIDIFPNRGTHGRQGQFSVWCYANGCDNLLFDIDGFDCAWDAAECVGGYIEFLRRIGIQVLNHNS